MGEPRGAVTAAEMAAALIVALREEAAGAQPRPHPPPAAGWGAPSEESWRKAHRMYRQNIFQVVTRRWAIFSWIYRVFNISHPDPDRCGMRVSVAEMQRMYLTALQAELVDIAAQMRWPTDLEKAVRTLPGILERYTQAVRDYEFMTSISQKPLDTFVISDERGHDRDILLFATNKAGKAMVDILGRETESADAKLKKPEHVTDTGPWEVVRNARVAPAGGTRGTNVRSVLRQAFWSRLGAALVGAVFLVGPMWLLALKRELYVHLGATTGFVLGFGFVIAFFVEKPDQVFAGTLGYAAVLMVFVGVVMDDGGQQGR